MARTRLRSQDTLIFLTNPITVSSVKSVPKNIFLSVLHALCERPKKIYLTEHTERDRHQSLS
jgi:hypothetical protein